MPNGVTEKKQQQESGFPEIFGKNHELPQPHFWRKR
jgi:hypothetical protein